MICSTVCFLGAMLPPFLSLVSLILTGPVLGGQVTAAVNYALRALPGFRHLGWRLLGYLYYMPGLRQLEDLGYA